MRDRGELAGDRLPHVVYLSPSQVIDPVSCLIYCLFQMRIPNVVPIFRVGAVIATTLIFGDCLIAQNHFSETIPSISASYATSESIKPFSSSNDVASDSAPVASTTSIPSGTVATARVRPFSQVGFDLHVGIGGVGFDVASPLSRKFNFRSGADFFSYAASFQEQGADITANLRLRSGHASLDWFPFGGRFRLSPLLVYGNNNQMMATALVPSGSTITLNGQDYISSYTNPLHGSGSVDFRKISPGFSLGFGDILPRKKGHFTIPIEAGFYYVGQPGLKVAFTGSACDPTQPASIGCESVDSDAGFQQNLAAFTARNNHNLSYASFFPILTMGLGYRF